MDPQEPLRPLGDALRASADYAARTREGLLAGLAAARDAVLHPPEEEDHARRFVFGLTAPLVLMRLAWRNKASRDALVRRQLPFFLIVLTFALALGKRTLEKVVSVWAGAGSGSGAAATFLDKLQTVGALAWEDLAKLVVTLTALEWILVWIGREHHDVIAADVAAASGVPSDPAPSPPRLRMDLAWVRMKGWRALRFVIFVALDAPLLWLLGKIPVAGPWAVAVAEAAWLSFWAAAFAIANGWGVWDVPLPPGFSPWFVRAPTWLGKIPVLGLPFRGYAWVLARVTRNVWPACRAFEIAPWESLGLALLRGVASMPVLYVLSRPFFTPAATHALLARSATRASP